MKSLIVYDTFFGNTLKIADAIASILGKDCKVISVNYTNKSDLKDINLLIVGSPILGWKPSEKTKKFLSSLTDGELKGVKATAYDTRLRLFIHGDAAKIIVRELSRAGADIVTGPKGFDVKGREGPLYDGELEKAKKWALEVKTKFEN